MSGFLGNNRTADFWEKIKSVFIKKDSIDDTLAVKDGVFGVSLPTKAMSSKEYEELGEEQKQENTLYVVQPAKSNLFVEIYDVEIEEGTKKSVSVKIESSGFMGMSQNVNFDSNTTMQDIADKLMDRTSFFYQMGFNTYYDEDKQEIVSTDDDGEPCTVTLSVDGEPVHKREGGTGGNISILYKGGTVSGGGTSFSTDDTLIMNKDDVLSVAIPTKPLTKSEYDALSEEKKMSEILYVTTDDVPVYEPDEEPDEVENSISVDIVWQDISEVDRPDLVNVLLYRTDKQTRETVLYESVQIEASDNWSHTWYDLKEIEDYIWTIMELPFPTNTATFAYSVTKDGNNFVIANYYTSVDTIPNPDPDTPPGPDLPPDVPDAPVG